MRSSGGRGAQGVPQDGPRTRDRHRARRARANEPIASSATTGFSASADRRKNSGPVRSRNRGGRDCSRTPQHFGSARRASRVCDPKIASALPPSQRTPTVYTVLTSTSHKDSDTLATANRRSQWANNGRGSLGDENCSTRMNKATRGNDRDRDSRARGPGMDHRGRVYAHPPSPGDRHREPPRLGTIARPRATLLGNDQEAVRAPIERISEVTNQKVTAFTAFRGEIALRSYSSWSGFGQGRDPRTAAVDDTTSQSGHKQTRAAVLDSRTAGDTTSPNLTHEPNFPPTHPPPRQSCKHQAHTSVTHHGAG